MGPQRYPTDREIWSLARDMGLDPYPVLFESVPAPVLYEFAAYLIPGRMSHWSYGKAYHAMKTRYDYGLNKLYEMVINSNPAYAFLLESNSDLENTFVRAHVMGHVDFFKNNQCFQHTVPDMIEVVSRHAERVRQYEFDVGREQVERFLDAVLALEEHVSPPSPTLPARQKEGSPPSALSRPAWADLTMSGQSPPVRRVPEVKAGTEETDDLLLFLMRESRHLEDWQRDIIGMVRDEMLYFWPQVRTKIMNEGWASYWHVTLMRELRLEDDDYLDFARLHSQVTAPMMYQINPYALGYAIFTDLERRYGREAMFLARTVDDDVSFVRNYLNEEIVESLNMMVYGAEDDAVVLKSRAAERVREQLVRELVHGGIPVIHVNDGDFNQRGELYLIHRHEGIDLDIPFAERALHYVHQLWGRPVHLETRSEEKRVILSYDGKADSKVVL
ncbi:SpoVR family protein [Sulfobacillus harzensis]|uniref:SpoVR family protein n=1 Tax=Sulfobacillus harzensis TaxID=2729629 RepID=A0A7Y0Q193_9FIRM|nr:SpoVR family protein [Sulfobacillus harzensis]NMP21858.1 SpoVR family protein [Sulfobacillus harzensis]